MNDAPTKQHSSTCIDAPYTCIKGHTPSVCYITSFADRRPRPLTARVQLHHSTRSAIGGPSTTASRGRAPPRPDPHVSSGGGGGGDGGGGWTGRGGGTGRSPRVFDPRRRNPSSRVPVEGGGVGGRSAGSAERGRRGKVYFPISSTSIWVCPFLALFLALFF